MIEPLKKVGATGCSIAKRLNTMGAKQRITLLVSLSLIL